MIYAKFDEKKALAAILFVARELQVRAPEKRADLYKLLKIIYFADRSHLSKYNRTIAGDHYVAMEKGPVPSRIFDMIKFVRKDGYYISKSASFMERLSNSLDVLGHISIIPKAEPDFDELSESDIECLERAIEKYKNFTLGQLKDASHDKAFDNADEDDCISFEDMAVAGGADYQTIGFIRTWLENENFLAR